MITIVDYGLGNLGSIANMFRRIGVSATLTRDPSEVARAEKLVLPGVGAFDKGMRNIRASGLAEVLNQKARVEQTPILGICLGMQLMTHDSEEGQESGLGWIEAHTVHLRTGNTDQAEGLKFPHIGWNFIDSVRSHPLLEDLPEDPRFYFVHSYRVRCNRDKDVLTETSYGAIRFASAFAHGNIAGVQFHPEKSHKYGMKLLRNFADWKPQETG